MFIAENPSLEYGKWPPELLHWFLDTSGQSGSDSDGTSSTTDKEGEDEDEDDEV